MDILLALLFANLCYGLARKGGGGEPLIVGGVEVAKGELPWMIDFRRNDSHGCGGSILTEDWVVTAIHCLRRSEFDISDYTLVAGDHDNSVDEGTEQRRAVALIVTHPFYADPEGMYQNDVALMKVSQPFVFNERVQPVKLAPVGFQPPPIGTTAGWGRTSEGGNVSNVLLKVDVPRITDEECRAVFGVSSILDSMVCSNGGEEGKDACNGDSGGPLMWINGTSTYLGGIVSWGIGCARPEYPGVFTEVSYFTEWIHHVINTS